MNRKNKILLFIIFTVLILFFIFRERYNVSPGFVRIILFLILFVAVHHLLYLFVRKMQDPKKKYLFAVTFFSGCVTLVLMIPFLINLSSQSSGEGGMNEDYSGIFFMISLIVTLVSFFIGMIYSRKISYLNE